MIRKAFILTVLAMTAAGLRAGAQIQASSKQPFNNDAAKRIVQNLSDTILPNAVIGIVNEGVDSDLESTSVPYQRLYISKGFKFLRLDHCRLFLHNDSGLIVDSFLGVHPNYKLVNAFFDNAEQNRSALSVDLVIPLNEISYKKGKAAYPSKNEAERYGTWRVQLKTKSEANTVLLEASNADETERISGGILTFGFDDETTGREFDTQFRLAAKQCRADDLPPEKPNGVIWKN